MMTAEQVRMALDLAPFEGFARKVRNDFPEQGEKGTGRTTRMLCSMLAAASSGRVVSVAARPQSTELNLKEMAREWANKLGINTNLIVGSLAPAEIEFFDHTYYFSG